MPSHTDTTGHTKAFDYPVMDHWRIVKGDSVFRCEADPDGRPVSSQGNTLTTRPCFLSSNIERAEYAIIDLPYNMAALSVI